MGLYDTIQKKVQGFLFGGDMATSQEYRQELFNRELVYSYYEGKQKEQMRVKPMQADDNLTTNFVGLVVDRSLSLLLGGGVSFDLPGDKDSPEQEYIDAVFAANMGDILLHTAGQHAGVSGTGYIKIIPDGLVKRGKVYPRLVTLDSRRMFIETQPEDKDTVTAYVWEAMVKDANGDDQRRKEVTRWETFDGEMNRPLSWVIENYVMNRGGRWELIGEPEQWPYPFPPIVHWQNLPKPFDVYGESDILDVIPIQDRYNFTSANTSRIIRYHAHPKTWGRDVNLGDKVSWGGDEMVTVTGDGTIQNLEMQSDLASSMQYLMNLRQSIFDITRTVDISSMADKVGQLTNFGLRVLYGDAIAKLATKQALMGEALEELIYRLLVLGEFTNTDPGIVVWPDNLPRNEFEDLQAATLELNAGLVSKQTVAGEHGRDWETEMERMQDEEAAAGNIGQALLQSFNRGF